MAHLFLNKNTKEEIGAKGTHQSSFDSLFPAREGHDRGHTGYWELIHGDLSCARKKNPACLTQTTARTKLTYNIYVSPYKQQKEFAAYTQTGQRQPIK